MSWEIGKLLRIITAIQLALLGLIGLGILGFDISLLRQIIGFLYLSFVPGIVILRIFRLHQLRSVETLLYSVGLSLAFIMFLGFFMNMLCPHIGISTPISTLPLIGAMTGILLILCVIAYKRDRDFQAAAQFNWRELLSAPALFLILLPLLSALGAEIVNVYHSNILLMVLIPLIALILILIAFDKFIPQRLYPLAVAMISLALLYHNSLISRYLTGFDIHSEYYFAKLVVMNSYWDAASSTHIYSAMLSITMLAPIYSIICGLELAWVFKIIYPLFCCLIPLGIYQICQRQTSNKIALLAAFFFVSVGSFFLILPYQAKHQVGELFLVLVVLLIVSKPMSPMARSALCLTFAASMAVSYYSISYFFMFSLIVVLLILFLSQKVLAVNPTKEPSDRGLVGKPSAQEAPLSPIYQGKLITATFVSFFIVVCLAWYIWHAGSTSFTAMVRIVHHIANVFLTELFSFETVEPISILMTVKSPVYEVQKYLHLFTQFLIGIGIIDLLIHWRRKQWDEEYSALSLVGFAVAAAAMVVPYFAFSFHSARLYHITLVFLAPFCITGAIVGYRFLFRGALSPIQAPLKALSVLLAVYLLCTTGFVGEVTKNYLSSISLSQESTKKYGDAERKVRFYDIYTPEEEVFSARWLSKNALRDRRIYAIYSGTTIHTLTSYGLIPEHKVHRLTPDRRAIPRGSYVYLQYVNVVEGLGTIFKKVALKHVRDIITMEEFSPLLAKTNKIYSNKGSEILFVNR